MFELTECVWVDVSHSARSIVGFRKTCTAPRYMAECCDVVARQLDPGQLFDFFTFEQNAKFFVADLRAFLKCDLVGACKHQRGDDERDSLCLLPHSCDRKIEPAAILRGFKTQIPNVLLHLFHGASSL